MTKGIYKRQERSCPAKTNKGISKKQKPERMDWVEDGEARLLNTPRSRRPLSLDADNIYTIGFKHLMKSQEDHTVYVTT